MSKEPTEKKTCNSVPTNIEYMLFFNRCTAKERISSLSHSTVLLRLLEIFSEVVTLSFYNPVDLANRNFT